jgi:hypothetical protein
MAGSTAAHHPPSDGATLTFAVLGPQLVFMNAQEFLPGSYLYSGRVVMTRDENGLISDLATAGTRSGTLCDQLG